MEILWPTREALFEIFPKRSKGIEIGVWEGDFSEKVLSIVHPSKFFLVDPWRRLDYPDPFTLVGDGAFAVVLAKVRQRFAKEIAAGIVNVVRGTSEEVASLFVNNRFDWVYLDGDHTFKGVAGDLERWWPMVKLGGLIMSHDWVTEPPGCEVPRAMAEWLQGRSDAKAVGVTGELRSKKTGTATAVIRRIA